MPIRLRFLLVPALFAAASGAAKDIDPPQTLPLRQVVLFSSGVGYFQRAGRVEGAATLELSFRGDQVNDILKSLVLFDPQGQVRPVTYNTTDPTLRAPGQSGQAIDASVTLGSLLRRFQGAQVRLQLGGAVIEGRVVSVSHKAVPAHEGQIVTAEVLNVLTDAGLRAVPLDQVESVKLLDDRLDRELRSTLETVARGLNDERKRVSLQFGGAGAREVRAGYLQETPVWKSSYRLVLSKDGKEKPYLQGWAIVENTTEEDWKEVGLSLVSGRPISFIQDLYQPLYIPRPVIQAQLVGSPNPQAYGEVLEEERAEPAGAADEERRVSLNLHGVPLRQAIEQLFAGSGLQYAVEANIPDVPITLAIRDVSLQAALRLLVRRAAAAVPNLTQSREGDVFIIRTRTATPPPPTAEPSRGFGGAPTAADALNARRDIGMSAALMAKSVASQAQGAERGELFEYALKEPISVRKGEAAMVPIVTSAIDGEALSIFDARSDAQHALLGFQLKNSTGLHLSGGPITVFQEGIYAGDAQINHLSPGEERLISYAVDLDLVTDREQPKYDQQTTTVTAKAGVLHVTRKQTREQVYTFRNKGKEQKKVLVQQPIEDEFKLISPEKPKEKTAAEYRFLVMVPPADTQSLKVVTERPLSEEIALINADLNLLNGYAQNGKLSEKLRAALKTLVEKRRKMTDLQGQRTTKEQEIVEITKEQDRIRQNMAQLDRNSALYQQYVKKLTDQETRIEVLRGEIAVLRSLETAAQKDLQVFLETLDV